MSSLPEDIYRDILLRVPVKSTFVCKCICKSWFQLVSDPDFAKMHLNRPTTTQTNNCSVLFKCYNDKNVYSIGYNSLSNDYSNDNDFVKKDFPYKSLDQIELLGSCNGVVYFRSCKMRLYFLWNPATKECKELPKSGINDNYLGRCYHGFGYDSVAGDYKLVEIDQTTSVQVYSLKSDSWRSIKSIQYELCSFRTTARPLCGLLFKGALHWLGWIRKEASSTMIIISMDINDETFREMQLSKTLSMKLSNTDSYNIDTGVLEGNLCVHVYDYGICNSSLEVWVMLDYGVPESWTKLHSITPDTWFPSSYYATSFKNGEILFKKIGGPLVLCDLKHGNVRNTYCYRVNAGSSVTYFESLVSLNAVGKERAITGNLKKSATNQQEKQVNILFSPCYQ